MKKRFFKSIVAVAAVIMSLTLVGCDDASVVQDGSPYDYPDQTWGEVLDDTCKNGEWESFTDEDDASIVEYNGTVKETGVDICIQFEVDGDEFEIIYMDFDGESCDEYEIAEAVTLLFE